MAQEKVVSYIHKKRSVHILGVFVITLVIFGCIIFPKIVFAEESTVRLGITVPSTEIGTLPEQNDLLREKRLISSLMKDVSIGQDRMIDDGHWQILRMRVTGYCPCSQCCGHFSDGVTANNHRIQPGDTFVAADKSFAFGTQMMIQGYNAGRPVQVMDRGGAIKDNRLDLFFHTHQQALQWGVQYLDVLVKIN